MAVARFPMDEEAKERPQCASIVPHLLDSAEMCLMTPPRDHMIDTLQCTPTANLKLLLKAASPDLHDREIHSSVNQALQTKPIVTVSANDCEADITTVDMYTENVSMDKQRRKDKSLGLLCER